MRDSLGEYEAVKMVLDLFAMSIPVATKNYLISQDTENAQKSVYHKQIDAIKRRSGIKLKKMRTQFIQERNDSLQGMIYAEGHALNAETAGRNAKLIAKKLCKCSDYTHQR